MSALGFRSGTRDLSSITGWLDLARGLAAVEVVAFHSYQLMFQEQLPGAGYDPSIVFAYSALWAFSGHGFDAVMVFFVLSGYLVGGPTVVRAKNGRLNAADFFSARASRLYVVLIPALVVSFCAYVLARHSGGWDSFMTARESFFAGPGVVFAAPSPVAALCNGLFLQTIACPPFAGNAALWSLSNEFWYYLLIFALVSLRKNPSFVFVVAAIFALFVVAERTGPAGMHNGLKFFFYFAIWCLGAAVYAIAAPIMLWAAAFLAALGGVYALLAKGLLPEWAAHSMAIGLLTAAAIVTLEFTQAALPSFLRFTKEIAKFSFSLYAIHYPLLVLLIVATTSGHADFTFASFALSALLTLTCLAIAVVFYLLFERNTLAVRAWLLNILNNGVAARQDTLRPAMAGIAMPLADNEAKLVAGRLEFVAAAGAAGVVERTSARGIGVERKMASVSEFRPRTVSGGKVGQLSLNDGHSIPQIGLGVWQIDDEVAPGIIDAAVDRGYRLIDTAADYGNEAGVGRGIALTSLPRDQFFITTKVRNDDQGYDKTLRAFDVSAAKLGLDVIDLYLIHWPCPQREAYVDTWRALIELRKSGRVKSIGVSNFEPEHLERIINDTGVVPAVNQIELHPGFQQRALRKVHERYGIVTEAWSPLSHGSSLGHPTLQAIAIRLKCTPAQVVLRWHVENGVVAIPKTVNRARMADNIAVFSFKLSDEDHAAIAGLDKPDGRNGPDPFTFGRERFVRRVFLNHLGL